MRFLTLSGSKLKHSIEGIITAPQPVLKEPSDSELLQEILGVTRNLVIEYQKLVQALRTNPEIEATVRALLRPDMMGTRLAVAYGLAARGPHRARRDGVPRQRHASRRDRQAASPCAPRSPGALLAVPFELI